VGLYFTTLPATEFLAHPLTHLFALTNTTLFGGVTFSLPGVRFNSPLPFRVNGPIWTLFYEVWMYAILVFMWAILNFLKSNKIKVFSELIIWLAIASFILQLADHFYLHWYSLYLRLFYMFFSGATYFVLKDNIIISNRVFWLMIVGLLISTCDKQVYFVFYNCFLAYIVFWLAYVPAGRIRYFNQFGDYSYGMYIYAYPVQQTICTLFASIGIMGLMITSTAITFFIAYLSWHLVEKKALALKRLKLKSLYIQLFRR
jgi:peptidoglycan/LPS O-acetylase OafA/YrhL